MKLSTGHFLSIIRDGIHKDFDTHTVHIIEVYESEEAFQKKLPPLTTQDLTIQWNGSHPNPGERLVRIMEWYCKSWGQHGFKDPHTTSNLRAGVDRHGNLMHPNMPRAGNI